MNFHITRHTPIRKRKRRVTKETELEALSSWAQRAQHGDSLDVTPAHPDYEALRKLKGYIRIGGKWKAFITVHADRVNVLHCGNTPTLL